MDTAEEVVRVLSGREPRNPVNSRNAASKCAGVTLADVSVSVLFVLNLKVLLPGSAPFLKRGQVKRDG
jgi:hypothetical protein